MPAPATLEFTRRGVVDRDALLVDYVDLVGDLVELKAPHVHDRVDVLVVLGRLGRPVVGICAKSWRPATEVPDKLAVARELQDTVLRRLARNISSKIDFEQSRQDRSSRMS